MSKFALLAAVSIGLFSAAVLLGPAAVAEPADSSDAAVTHGTTSYFGPRAPAPETTGALQTPNTEPQSAAPSTGSPDASAKPASADSGNSSSESSTPATAAAPDPQPVSPVVTAIRAKLSDKSLSGRDIIANDVAALADFYNATTEPVWTRDGAFNDKAKAIIAELKKADDWGLEPSDFVVPDLASGATSESQAEAEVRLALAAMKYARFARGGRLSPVALSNILDMAPPVMDPKTVVSELSAASAPAAYLRGLNPKHDGFEKLRQALLKMRGPKKDEEQIDPALLVKIPNAKTLKPGAQDDQVSLLRQRLKVPAQSADDESKYDEALQDAVKSFQQANGLRANGVITNATRSALNKEGQPKKADPQREQDRIIANMERWRWLPENLGHFYVMNNIPEFVSEMYDGGKRVIRQKMIVGQPSWPTPVLTADMETVTTHPSWGMPPGIKAKELLPRLRAAGGSGFGFFDQLFGGGGSGSGAIIRAYKLQAFCNGHQVDPDSVTAENARNCGFTQPPGPTNPLGTVKFRFPNRHDVYMHDTPERNLFAQSFRALSHGCMRIDEPKRTAEIILAADKGWSAEKVDGLFSGSTEVKLNKTIPVYLVYFTARVDDEGHLDRFGDIYGHDDRIMAALRGHPVRYSAPEAVEDQDESSPAPSASQPDTISDAGGNSLQDPGITKKRKSSKQATSKRKREPQTAGDVFINALGGAFLKN